MFRFHNPNATRLAARAGFILVLGTGLGLAYNSSTPIGIRFSSQPSPAVAGVTKPVAQPTNGAPPAAPAQDILTVTWSQVKPLAESGQVLLVDARAPSHFEAGRIPGAVSLYANATDEQIAAFKARHRTDTPIVIYCVDTKCPLSKQLAQRLTTEHSYGSVTVMPGGYSEWLAYQANGPSPAEMNKLWQEVAPGGLLSTPGGQVEVQSVNASAAPPIPMVSWEEVKPWIESGDVVIVDARPRPGFEAGHIPGAISLPYSSASSELPALQESIGLDARIVIYCGAENCSLSRQLAEMMQQQGFSNVQYVSGGYQEWQRLEALGRKPGS